MGRVILVSNRLPVGVRRVGEHVQVDPDVAGGLVAGLGPDPAAGTTVSVFSYDGSQVTSWATLESFAGLAEGATVATGRF